WAVAIARAISPDLAAGSSRPPSSPKCCAKKCSAPWSTPSGTAGACKCRRLMSSTGPAANVNLWPSAQHAREYLERADAIPHRREGEAALLEFLPPRVSRFLDIGAGGGRLLSFVKSAHPSAECVALDFSPTMLQVLRETFGSEPGISIVEHNL